MHELTLSYVTREKYNQIQNCLKMHLKPNPEDEGKITKEFLKKLVKSDFKQYYSTPHLNDSLYLHYKGFTHISNLEAYTGLKVLYLEGNAIKKIEGLDTLTDIRCLYIQENLISTIENLDFLSNLVNLNLSDNQLYKIEGLSKLRKLQNLQVKRNRIGCEGVQDLKGLLECPSISALDISDNCIETTEIIPEILKNMPQIAVVYLQNNKFNKKVAHYRKTLITEVPTLKYIDDKPIFEDEKRYAQAWARGGLDEERKERELYRKEKEEEQLRQHRQFKEMMEKYKQQGRMRREAEEKEHSSENENQSDSKEENLESYHTPSQNEANSRTQTEPSIPSEQSSQKAEESEPSERSSHKAEQSDREKSQRSNQEKDGYLDELD